MHAGYDPKPDSGKVTTMRRRTLSEITDRRKPGDPRRGWLTAGALTLPVALARGGVRTNKREGDFGIPLVTFRPKRVWWRNFLQGRPLTYLTLRRIRREYGWCEDPA